MQKQFSLSRCSRLIWLRGSLSLLLLCLRTLAQTPELASASVQMELRAKTSARVRVPLAQAEPFLAVGVQWEAGDVALRASPDGAAWSEWIALVPNHDVENTSSETAQRHATLLFLPAATRWIELQPRANSNATGLLRLQFISPGATATGAYERLRQRQFVPMEKEQANPKYPKPPVTTRTEWGCPDGQTTKYGTLAYTTVTHLIVHHTATPNTPTNNDWPAVVRSIWNFHIFTNGWSDIGYNYLIDPNGVIYEGRSGGDNVQGAHFSGVNSGTMGVSMLGTFTSVTPTPAALTSLRRVLAWKADQRGIDPTGKTLHAASRLELNNISGHRDGPGATECPGDALYPLLPELRTGVRELLTRASTPAALANVSAASYQGGTLAPDSIVAAFGNRLASNIAVAMTTPLPTELGGTSVTIRDSAGRETLAPLFFVAPGQVNYLLPANVALGAATITIANASGELATGNITIEATAPSLFAANANGKDVPAAVLLRVKADGTQVYEALATFDETTKQFVALPIDLGNSAEQVFLIAYGTGLRNRSALSAAVTQIGGLDAPISYVGPIAGFAGLDQVNIKLPAQLAGRGKVELQLTVDGKTANVVSLRIR